MRRSYRFDPIDSVKYPISEVTTRHVTGRDGKLTLRVEQRVDQIAEECKHLRNHHPANGYTMSGESQLVARIPMVKAHMLYRRFGRDFFSDNVLLNRWLNSPDAAPWRTSTGEV